MRFLRVLAGAAFGAIVGVAVVVVCVAVCTSSGAPHDIKEGIAALAWAGLASVVGFMAGAGLAFRRTRPKPPADPKPPENPPR